LTGPIGYVYSRNQEAIDLDEKSNFGKHGHDKQGPSTHGNLLCILPHLASATQSTLQREDESLLQLESRNGDSFVVRSRLRQAMRCGLDGAGEAANSKKSQ